ncbi:Arp2/3 complex 16 kDa subunit ARPC5 [Myriangium duriaei CBS 260.36]|uniref:Actin-related protein 2/3 complex subunit 5 n=1 Tax=Myriangium duriaei CBS 260.36 TaxID=1168546 RepID=A0A9P4MKN3_9PEZI|nr:Arp2/3 complex 16 kDa subunit ARPC5 [Myriangium duriaei CBS 260.36]
MAEVNWRTINIDALDPDSAYNFDLTTFTPNVQPVSTADVQTLAGQVKQLLRGGDQEGALVGALENVPYGADTQGKDIHLATITEILQSIRQSEMTPILQRLQQAPNGTELCDTLMKYLYKGMAQPPPVQPARAAAPQQSGFSQIGSRVGAGEGQGHAMSVLLSWHEKLVELAGPGSIVRVMSDRRTV